VKLEPVTTITPAGAYGEGIDGQLGMSLLSPFNINIDAKTARDPHLHNRPKLQSYVNCFAAR
jgi:hypothetical protein